MRITAPGRELAGLGGECALEREPGDVMSELVQRIDDLTGRFRSAAAQCADIASECRHRAQVCRRYTAAYLSYEYAAAAWERRAREAEPGEWIGSRPQLPWRPAPRAERG